MDFGIRVPETKSVPVTSNVTKKLTAFVLAPLVASAVIGVLLGSESPVFGATVARALIETLSALTAPIWLLPIGGGSFVAWRWSRGTPPSGRRSAWYWARLFWKTFLPMISAFVGYILGTSIAIRALLL